MRDPTELVDKGVIISDIHLPRGFIRVLSQRFGTPYGQVENEIARTLSALGREMILAVKLSMFHREDLSILQSITHGPFYVGCATTDTNHATVLGYDAEVAKPLPQEIWNRVSSRTQREQFVSDQSDVPPEAQELVTRIAFCSKEAAVKAAGPTTLGRTWLGDWDMRLWPDGLLTGRYQKTPRSEYLEGAVRGYWGWTTEICWAIVVHLE